MGHEPDYEKLIREAQESVSSTNGNGSYDGANSFAKLYVDIPDSALDGRLGDICQRKMHGFPLAYSWPSILATASAMLEKRNPIVRTNLYVALVGPVHSGKSQAIKYALKTLSCEPPIAMDLLSGSGEQLVRKTKDAKGEGRLFSPDELGHLFEKMRIERSSFSFILNRAYYDDKFEVAMGKKENVIFDCCLSILGGIVEEKFEQLFDASATGGLYDRFLFGYCPPAFVYDYRPFEGEGLKLDSGGVFVEPEVWEAKSQLLKDHRDWNPRVVEHAIRAAVVCAAYDRRGRLKADELGPAFEFTRYQHYCRDILKPNVGENQEARVAWKFLNYLGQRQGKWVTRRQLYRDTHAYDLGPSNCDRALSVLVQNGDIVRQKLGKILSYKRPYDIEMED